MKRYFNSRLIDKEPSKYTSKISPRSKAITENQLVRFWIDVKYISNITNIKFIFPTNKNINDNINLIRSQYEKFAGLRKKFQMIMMLMMLMK